MSIRALVLLVFTALACQQQSEFSRSVELLNYLDRVQHLSTDSIQAVVILQTGFCGVCNDEDNLKLKKILARSEMPVRIIVPDSNDRYYRIFKNIAQVTIHVDHDRELKKHGLSQFANNLFFIVEDRKVTAWSALEGKSINRISRLLD